MIVEGRAIPGKFVEILDQDSNAVLGSGTVNQQGFFIVNLTVPLRIGQRVYARSEGIQGAPVVVVGNTFLTLVAR